MNPRDRNWIAGFLAAGAVGLAVFIGLYDRAFPAAKLDFRLDRDGALASAERFLVGRGIDLRRYDHTIVFDGDDEAQMYLEKSLGLEETNRLARAGVSIWAWHARWFRPEQKEEFRVSLDPAGRIVGYRHLKLDTDPGGNPGSEDALAIASSFLGARGYDLRDYELLERSREARERRTDHTFAYQKRDFRVYRAGVAPPRTPADSLSAGEPGTYRLRVTVLGDSVGSFQEYLKVPEAFLREYEGARSRAMLLTQMAVVLWLALGIAMVVFLIRRTREGALTYRTALYLGLAVALLWFTAGLNSLPLTRFGYDTQSSYPSFLLMVLLGSGLAGLFYGLVICLSGITGGSCYREAFPDGSRDPLGRITWRNLVTAPAMRAALIGYGTAGCHLGYVTLFYLAGVRFFGVWAPAETNYTNALSTRIPWIYALQIGLAASALEELFFRLFSISYLKKITGRTWVAVLVPAVVWGFLHSGYAVEPIYIRGVELTVVGVVFGLVFLRFGIWAAVIAHYAYDAALVALPMIQSSSLYFRASGLIVVGLVLLPAIAATVYRLARGRWAPVSEDPAEATVPRIAPPPPADREGEPEASRFAEGSRISEPGSALPILSGMLLDRRTRGMALLAGLVGLVLVVAADTDRFGERSMRIRISREEAVRTAEAFVSGTGLSTASLRRVAWFQEDLGSKANTFLVRNATPARAESLAVEMTRPWRWWVRWYRPLEREEFRVAVDARTGRISGWSRILPEDRPGADLPAPEARGRAETFVRAHFLEDLGDTTRHTLRESSSELRKGRRDHDFVWERADARIGEGVFRTSVTVQGEGVDRVTLDFKPPESFLRELNRQTAVDVAAILCMGIALVLTVVWATISFIHLYRDRELRWGFPGLSALVLAVAMGVGHLNLITTFYANYPTSVGLPTFGAGRILTWILAVGFQAGAIALAWSLSEALWSRSFPGAPGIEGWLRGLWKGLPGRLPGEALLLAASLWAWSRGLGAASRWIAMRLYPQYATASNLAPVRELQGLLPALALDGVAGKFLVALLVFCGILVWLRRMRRPWRVALAAMGFMLLLALPSSRTSGHSAARLLPVLLPMAGMAWFAIRIVRLRLLTYLFFLWAMAFVVPGIRLLQATEPPFYQVNGIALIAVGLAPLWFPIRALLSPGEIGDGGKG